MYTPSGGCDCGGTLTDCEGTCGEYAEAHFDECNVCHDTDLPSVYNGWQVVTDNSGNTVGCPWASDSMPSEQGQIGFESCLAMCENNEGCNTFELADDGTCWTWSNGQCNLSEGNIEDLTLEFNPDEYIWQTSYHVYYYSGACDCEGTMIDSCGVCGGDGTTCSEYTLDILYDTDTDIAGFQFNIDGADLISTNGGAAESAGFTVSSGGSTVLGFSFTGTSIPAGSGVLTTLTLSGGDACLSDLVLSGQGGLTLSNAEVLDCSTISYVGNTDVNGCTDSDDICDCLETVEPFYSHAIS